MASRSLCPETPDEAELERVRESACRHALRGAVSAPEFTCLCPVTGQPDFAHFVVKFPTNEWLIKSKSLKLYLASFRNHGAFHEDCTVAIGKRIAKLTEPHYLRIGGYWFPRGGMPINVFWQMETLPDGIWLPDQGVVLYRGRG